MLLLRAAFSAAFLIVLGFSPHAHAQVNIEQIKPNIEPGFHGSVSAMYAIRSGNQSLFDLGVQGRIGYRSDRSETFLIGQSRYGKSENTTYANRSFLHARFVSRIDRRASPEVFAQLENDAFTRLQLRTLAGTGIRLNLFERDRFQWSHGTGPMIVNERLDASTVTFHPSNQTVWRWNNYTSLRADLTQSISFLTTIYVQPQLDQFDDVRLLLDGTLAISIASWLTLTHVVHLRYDSEPPDGIGTTDLEVRNGLQVSF